MIIIMMMMTMTIVTVRDRVLVNFVIFYVNVNKVWGGEGGGGGGGGEGAYYDFFLRIPFVEFLSQRAALAKHVLGQLLAAV